MVKFIHKIMTADAEILALAWKSNQEYDGVEKIINFLLITIIVKVSI